MTRSLAILSALALLAGCSNLTQGLENRLACTAAGDTLFAVSQYGPIGISSKISEKDRAVVCPVP